MAKNKDNQRPADPQRDRLSGNSGLDQNTNGQGNQSGDARSSRGGLSDMGSTGNATRRGDSGISTKRSVTGSDYDGQVSGS